MRNIPSQSITALACELAALLMVVEECEVDPIGRESLISLARRTSDSLATAMQEQDSKGALNG